MVELNDNFKRWFGNSKVVDNQGNPLVVYHGTPRSFTKFDIEHASPYGLAGSGFYFTDSEAVAGSYLGGVTNRRSDDSHVKKCYLKMENPYYWDTPMPDDEIHKLAETFKANEDEFFFKHILDSVDDYDDSTYPTGWEFDEGGSFGEITRESLQAAIKWLYDHGVCETPDLSRGNVWCLLTDDYSWISAKRVLKSFIEKLGYDGVIYEAEGDLKGPNSSVSGKNNCYVVYKPNQIKSVENAGNWSDSDGINENIFERLNKVIEGYLC